MTPYFKDSRLYEICKKNCYLYYTFCIQSHIVKNTLYRLFFGNFSHWDAHKHEAQNNLITEAIRNFSSNRSI